MDHNVLSVSPRKCKWTIIPFGVDHVVSYGLRAGGVRLQVKMILYWVMELRKEKPSFLMTPTCIKPFSRELEAPVGLITDKDAIDF